MFQFQGRHRQPRWGPADFATSGQGSIQLNLIGQTAWCALDGQGCLGARKTPQSDTVVLIQVILIRNFQIVQVIQCRTGSIGAGFGAIIVAGQRRRGPIRFDDADI